MKYITILSLLLISIILSSCEEIIENPNLPFEERLVVYGILSPNQKLRLYVTTTIPSLSNEPAFPLLPDANVQIESDGITYKLLYTNDINQLLGSYYTTNEINFQEGKQYNLTVQWNGKSVRSTTFIPIKPSVMSIWDSDTTFSNNGPFGNEGIYRRNVSSPAITNAMITGISYFEGDTNFRIFDNVDFSERYNVLDYDKLSDSSIISVEKIISPFANENVYIRLLSVDQSYHLYLSTLDRRNNNDGIFGGGGGNPIWNVYGDGFGLFLGVNKGYAIRL